MILSGTENRNVTLNIYHPITGSSMRFSMANINRSSWESYATSKSRTLSDVSGQKTVYAEFTQIVMEIQIILYLIVFN